MENDSCGSSKFLIPCESLHKTEQLESKPKNPWVTFTTKPFDSLTIFDSLTTNSIIQRTETNHQQPQPFSPTPPPTCFLLVSK